MSTLYALAAPFVGHAGRAFAVALALLCIGAFLTMRRGRPERTRGESWALPLLILGGAWFVFGLAEAEATRARANIRIDLIVTWPTLCVVSLACVIWCLRTWRSVLAGDGDDKNDAREV
jgi:hypothetical protein